MKMKMTVLAVVLAATPQTRATIHRTFRPDTFEVVWAADAAEAVAESARRPPDLVLLDLNPGLPSSWEQFESLRAVNPSAPVVVFAERGTGQSRNLASDQTAVAEKPVNPSVLADAVSVLLGCAPGSSVPMCSESGAAGPAGHESIEFRDNLVRDDPPLAWPPTYRHWGINE